MRKFIFTLLVQFATVGNAALAQSVDGYAGALRSSTLSPSVRKEITGVLSKASTPESKTYLSLLNGELTLIAINTDPILKGGDGKSMEGVDGESLIAINTDPILRGNSSVGFDGVDGESLIAINTDPILRGVDSGFFDRIESGSLVGFSWGVTQMPQALSSLKGQVSGAAFSELRGKMRNVAQGMKGLVIVRLQ